MLKYTFWRTQEPALWGPSILLQDSAESMVRHLNGRSIVRPLFCPVLPLCLCLPAFKPASASPSCVWAPGPSSWSHLAMILSGKSQEDPGWTYFACFFMGQAGLSDYGGISRVSRKTKQCGDKIMHKFWDSGQLMLVSLERNFLKSALWCDPGILYRSNGLSSNPSASDLASY